jgi:hypothetical protein
MRRERVLQIDESHVRARRVVCYTRISSTVTVEDCWKRYCHMGRTP